MLFKYYRLFFSQAFNYKIYNELFFIVHLLHRVNSHTFMVFHLITKNHCTILKEHKKLPFTQE
jgi:hypothetical protein